MSRTELIPQTDSQLDAKTTKPLGITLTSTLMLTVSGEQFELKGEIGAHIKVCYRKPFKESISIGSFVNIIGAVDKALSLKNEGPDKPGRLETEWNKIEANPDLPQFFKDIIKKVSEAAIRITYLEINTLTGKYGFGFGLDFSENPFKAGSIELTGFVLELSYTKTASLNLSEENSTVLLAETAT